MGMTMKSILWCLFISSFSHQGGANCNRTWHGPTGNWKTPNFPKPYDSNLDCFLHITTAPGTRILITVPVFKLERKWKAKAWKANLCPDYLKIVDKCNGKELANRCGERTRFQIASDTNKIIIHFHSDHEHNQKGVNITWKEIPTNSAYQCELTTKGNTLLSTTKQSLNRIVSLSTTTPKSTRLYQSTMPDITTLYQSTMPESTRLYETTMPESTRLYETTMPESTRLYETTMPESTRLYKTTTPKSTRLYQTNMSESTRLHRTTMPKSTRLYESTMTESDRLYQSTVPESTRQNQTAILETTRLYLTSTLEPTKQHQTLMQESTTQKETQNNEAQTVFVFVIVSVSLLDFIIIFTGCFLWRKKKRCFCIRKRRRENSYPNEALWANPVEISFDRNSQSESQNLYHEIKIRDLMPIIGPNNLKVEYSFCSPYGVGQTSDILIPMEVSNNALSKSNSDGHEVTTVNLKGNEFTQSKKPPPSKQEVKPKLLYYELENGNEFQGNKLVMTEKAFDPKQYFMVEYPYSESMPPEGQYDILRQRRKRKSFLEKVRLYGVVRDHKTFKRGSAVYDLTTRQKSKTDICLHHKKMEGNNA